MSFTAAQKAAVLTAICSTENYQIHELDFAGGDPLVNESSRKLIHTAQELLGRDAVSVTTTYRGIERADKDELSSLLYSCELTVDLPLDADQRGEATYSYGNLNAILRYSDQIALITINIVITDTYVSEKDVLLLCKCLNRFKDCAIRVVVIRLMPVGGLTGERLSYRSAPEMTVAFLKKHLHPNISIHLHCVLRGSIDKDPRHCGAEFRKIGIDCAGNAFGCAWAGDSFTDRAPNKNPFYLGNLLENTLDEIMSSINADKLSRLAKRAGVGCPLLSRIAWQGWLVAMDKDELLERYNTAKYILEISYRQLERYDGKTNQLMSLIGIDFTVLGIFATILFANMSVVPDLVKSLFLTFIPVDLALVVLSLYVVKQTLSPHLKPVDKNKKAKNGLIFFVDVDTAFTKDEYVDTLIGESALKQSSRYDWDDSDAFYKCIIEDCAYDIYEQAEILQVKSKYIKKSYRWVFCATVLIFITVILLSVLSFVGI